MNFFETEAPKTKIVQKYLNLNGTIRWRCTLSKWMNKSEKDVNACIATLWTWSGKAKMRIELCEIRNWPNERLSFISKNSNSSSSNNKRFTRNSIQTHLTLVVFTPQFTHSDFFYASIKCVRFFRCCCWWCFSHANVFFLYFLPLFFNGHNNLQNL